MSPRTRIATDPIVKATVTFPNEIPQLQLSWKRHYNENGIDSVVSYARNPADNGWIRTINTMGEPLVRWPIEGEPIDDVFKVIRQNIEKAASLL